MEVLWLVIGVLVGVVAAWLYLDVRFRRRLSEHEARLSETNRRIQQALERELGAHEGTKQRLARMNDEDAASKERIAGLNADLDAVRRVIESVKADAGEKGLELARMHVKNEELQTALDAIDDERTHFDAVVNRARSDSKAAADQVRAQIAALETRLRTSDQAAGEDQSSGREADTAAVDESKTRIADLESRLRERDEAIAALEAELAAARPVGGGEGA